ncbi:transposase IS4 family protein [Chthoniobacter flavus Ellin428]|uniref:Transposase IS4 family protein n=2 Tax=Chthoniobacter flavus TaxID=191863 RepID=B4CU16_9BACT|nr:IS1634 family transposase [Chthoniobacter flavus]EDY22054.1 transposase IS4 family protein [Chthoniobacter flavus Ellin428]
MFLRRNRRQKNGQQYEYWTLVESHRTERGPRQRVVATLGKLPGLDEEERAGWEEIARLLDGDGAPAEPTPPGDLFGSPAAPPSLPPPQWAQVDLSRVRVERLRQFGQVYLALALWRRLGLHDFFFAHLRRGREEIDWATVAAILCIGRFCAQASELALSERWYGQTALDDLLGVGVEAVYDNRLYRGLDALLPLRQALFGHLKERYESLFGQRFEFLLYDITSTYFEGQCAGNPQAQRGYSRDQRADCKQVCIGLVVTPEGLPLAYEVFDGNRADVTTVEEIVELMEQHYGVAQRIWAMDRGMVSEENLDYLREKQALYIVGTPKGRLKAFEKQLLENHDWQQVEAGVEVKLLPHPDQEGGERYVLCRSRARSEKEKAMLRGQQERLRKKLAQIDAALRKKPAKSPRVIERRIGKWLGRNTAAEKLFAVEVLVGKGRAVGLRVSEDPSKTEWAQAAHGAYLLRTNCTEEDPGKLWRWYIQLTEVEDAFRTSKSDLGLRPVFHQKEDRGAGPHPGLLPGAGHVAHLGTLAQSQGHGRHRSASGAGTRHHSFHGPLVQRP